MVNVFPKNLISLRTWKHILELRFLRKELFMNTLKYLFTCLYLLTLPLGALAQQVESYLTREQLPDAVTFLPAPPAERTPQAEADKAGIPMDEREFHCKGEFKGVHKGKPDQEDLKAVQEFTRKIIG